MNLEEARYQEIEDYLKGNLSPEEKNSFEGRMSTDSTLSEDVAVQRVALKSLELAYIQSMSELVRERVHKNNVAKKYWIGGSALLMTTLLVGGSYLLLTDKTESSASNKSTLVTTNESNVADSNKKSEIDNNQISNTTQNKKQLNRLANTATVENRITAAPSEDSTLLNRYKITESTNTKRIQEESLQKQIETSTPNIFKEQQAVAKTACPEKAPEISVRVTPTSYDEASGSITINTPAHWMVYLKGVNTGYENKNQFTDLAAGSYILYVQNENKCNYQIGTYVVTNSNCSFEQNYVFNKQFDQTWNIPALTSTAFKVSILNKAGVEVFAENVAAHHTATWNGENKNGEKVAIGLHKVIITYSDNKTCIYNVVVSE
jgi:hypothetical protein